MTSADVTSSRPASGLERVRSSPRPGGERRLGAMAVTLPEVVEELLSEMAAAVRDGTRSRARGLFILTPHGSASNACARCLNTGI